MVKRECTPIPPEDIILLLHGDGADGSTNITDSSVYGHPVTVNGNAQISTAQSVYPGGSSMYFDGNGDYLSVPNDVFGDNLTFTIECYVRFSSLTSNGPLFCFDTTNCDVYYRAVSGRIAVFATTGVTFQSSYTPAVNTWIHIAIVIVNGQCDLFIDGTKQNTSKFAIGLTFTGFTIGTDFADYLHGYLQDFRITKNRALYTTNFTPPTAPLPEPGFC